MWAKLDAAQLRGWQYAINQYGKHTGRSQYDVARFLAMTYAAGMITDAFNGVTFPERIIGALLAVMAILAAMVMFFGANMDEKSAIRGFLGSARILKENWPNRFNRAVQSGILYLSVVSCIALWRLRPLDFSYLAMWGYWYVIICDPPPPPQEREIGENSVWNGA